MLRYLEFRAFLEFEETDQNIVDKFLYRRLEKSQPLELICLLDREISQINDFRDLGWKKSHSLLYLLKYVMPTILREHKIEWYIPMILSQLENPNKNIRKDGNEILGEIAKVSVHIIPNNVLIKIIKYIKIYLIKQKSNICSPLHVEVEELTNIFHRPIGWICAATALEALSTLIKNCGSTFDKYLSVDLINIITDISREKDKRLRLSLTEVLQNLFEINIYEFLVENNLLEHVADILVTYLNDYCLCVRLSASICSFFFIQTLERNFKYILLNMFIPIILLNRHYSSNKIILYSNKLWDTISIPKVLFSSYYFFEKTKLHGRKVWYICPDVVGIDIIKNRLDILINYFQNKTKDNNELVKRAAILSMVEISYILSAELSEVVTKNIYDTLLCYIQQNSWFIKCVAIWGLGVHISSHPNFFNRYQREILSIYINNLNDNQFCVIEATSHSISYLTNTYPSEICIFLERYFNEKLDALLNSSQKTRKNSVQAINILGGKYKYPVNDYLTIEGDRTESEHFLLPCINLFGKLSMFYSNNISPNFKTFLNFRNDIKKESELMIKQLIYFQIPKLSIIFKNRNFSLYDYTLQNICIIL
ncbi:hypothetical protein HZS_1372 [Henneguya salminicola]|nr:hypothetical protein HZS_1372 [Henneguya salminicola]